MDLKPNERVNERVALWKRIAHGCIFCECVCLVDLRV